MMLAKRQCYIKLYFIGVGGATQVKQKVSDSDMIDDSRCSERERERETKQTNLHPTTTPILSFPNHFHLFFWISIFISAHKNK